MLPKKNRLNLKLEKNRRLFKNLRYDSFGIKYYVQKNEELRFQAAAVPSVKNFNKAVERNKVRRIVYQVVDSHPIKNLSVKLVLVVYGKKILTDSAEVEKDIRKKLVLIAEKFNV